LIESVRPKVPEKRGNNQAGSVHDNARSRVEAKYLAGRYQKRKRPQQGPEPAQFDQILVEKRVAVGEVDFRKLDEVADYGSDQQYQIHQQPFVRREKQIFSAREQQHRQEYAGHGRRVPDQQRAFGLGSHGQTRRYVVRFDRPRPSAPLGGHVWGRKR